MSMRWAIWNANQTDANIKAQRDLDDGELGSDDHYVADRHDGRQHHQGRYRVDSGSVPSVLLSAPEQGFIFRQGVA